MDAVPHAASTLIECGDAPLALRYTDDAVRILDGDERRRFLDDAGVARSEDQLPWELLYRIEPELYARLVAGERLHEGILEWLPRRAGRVLEIGAGTGRLTLDLAARANHLTAVEPALLLHGILRDRLAAVGANNVEVVRGFFDDLPARPAHDMVISCSAFSAQALAAPGHCVRLMEDACVPGGLVVLVWPADVAWLAEQGFRHVVFEGPMVVEYRSVDEAAALARIFYPTAAAAVEQMGSRFVDFVTLGLNAPRDLCWKRVQ